MKPIVLCGKGESAVLVPQDRRYDVAAVSEAALLCKSVDFLGVNDMPALRAMPVACFMVSKAIVCPTHLHVDTRAVNVVYWQEAKHLFRGVPARLIALHTKRPCDDSDVLDVGLCWSTAESLTAFLINEGYREFIFNGIENGSDKYHPMFKPRAIKNRGHFSHNFQRVTKRIKDAGGTWKHLVGLETGR